MQAIRQSLDAGRALPLPDGILINGLPQGSVFTGDQGTCGQDFMNLQPR